MELQNVETAPQLVEQSRENPELYQQEGYIHCSLYTVLINSNRNPDPGSFDEFVLLENMKAAFNHTFRQQQIYRDTYNQREMDAGWMTRAQVVPGRHERGRKNNNLHFHGMVRIEHFGIMHIDYREMHRIFREWWQNHGYAEYKPFMSVRFRRDMACAQELYANKEDNPLKDLFDTMRADWRQEANERMEQTGVKDINFENLPGAQEKDKYS